MKKSNPGLDHSKNRLDALSMGAGKKYRAVIKDRLLPRQFQNLKLPNLQEATFKADKIKLSGFEASGVELTCKFHDPNPKVFEPQEIKKEKTISDKLWLFIVKQSIIAFFQLIIMNYSQFLPYIIFLIFSLVLVY
jgi:hypothetical protein